jgi:hypothetical protein
MELIANKSFLVKKDAKSLSDLKKKIGITKKKKVIFISIFPRRIKWDQKKLEKIMSG